MPCFSNVAPTCLIVWFLIFIHSWLGQISTGLCSSSDQMNQQQNNTYPTVKNSLFLTFPWRRIAKLLQIDLLRPMCTIQKRRWLKLGDPIEYQNDGVHANSYTFQCRLLWKRITALIVLVFCFVITEICTSVVVYCSICCAAGLPGTFHVTVVCWRKSAVLVCSRRVLPLGIKMICGFIQR